MKLWSWNKGRRNTGYEAFPFFITKFCDAYLLRYRPGTEIPWHRDPIPGKNHYRLNIILNYTEGGIFLCNGFLMYESQNIKLFRPDLYDHCVTRVHKGTRYVLSFGLASKRFFRVGKY